MRQFHRACPDTTRHSSRPGVATWVRQANTPNRDNSRKEYEGGTRERRKRGRKEWRRPELES